MASNIGGLQRKWDPSKTLTIKERKREDQKNVLTRMTGQLSVGPFSLMLRSIREHLKIRVWTRSFNHVRGVCTGYVIAYDKHFNMAMCDVDEVYRNPRCLLRPKTAKTKRKKKKNKKNSKKAESTTEGISGKANNSGASNQKGSVTESSDQLSDLNNPIINTINDTQEEQNQGKPIDKKSTESVLNPEQSKVEAKAVSNTGKTKDELVNVSNADKSKSESGQESKSQLSKDEGLQNTHRTESSEPVLLSATGNSQDTGRQISSIEKDSHKSIGLKSSIEKASRDLDSNSEADDKSADDKSEPEEELPTNEEDLSNLLESLKKELAELPSTEASDASGHVTTSCDDSDVDVTSRLKHKLTLRHKHDDNSLDESDSSADGGNVSDSHKSGKTGGDLRQKLLKKRLDRSSRQKERSDERYKSHGNSDKGKSRRSTRRDDENEENCSPRRSRDFSRDEKHAKSKTEDRSRRSTGQRRKSRERSPGRRRRSSERSPDRRRKSRERSPDRSRQTDRSRSRKRPDKRETGDRHDRVSDIRDESKERRDLSRDRKSGRTERHRPKSSRSKSISPDRSKKHLKNKSPPYSRDKSRGRRLRSREQTRSDEMDENIEYMKRHIAHSSVDKNDSRTPKRHPQVNQRFLDYNDDDIGRDYETEKEVLARHVNQLFIRGDNVVMVALVE